ncbi:pectin esterase [Nonomuraea sp. PA05]|uniref:pectinesterase family protein n=1 Tax=Nonomuraea sp. PA05 TaxID=2604466 RepID=UPI0011D6BBDD|nr:pectinesterase family protein [Nonomuraea sp. PA05]TYB54355.1 pectin esterase [Nonomuraea sp. PA05]
MRAAAILALVAGLLLVPAPAQAEQRADGFAGLNALGVDGTTGGAAGRTVTVDNLTDLERYATAAEPYVIKVRGSITMEPYGKEIAVASDKSIVGEGAGAEIVHGGFFLNGVHNVIIRNLTIRDSYVPGDWDGKTKDYDGIQMDGAHHVWIDHNHFTRTGDGLLDIRKDSDYVTVSWNVFSDHNKAVGVGWTANVVTKVTFHHNWIRGTHQRNASIDNTEAAHWYNNYVQDTAMYGTMIRGGGRLVVENSYYQGVPDPIVAKDPASQVVQRGNVLRDSPGRSDSAGAAFDPSAYYAYTLDPADKVPGIVSRGAGPLGAERRAPRRITVALDGTGDFASVQAAVGAAPRGAEITVGPGVYREMPRVWAGRRDLTIKGATGNAEDVVITYDLSAGAAKFYGGTWGTAQSATLAVLADGVTVRDVTLQNATDETVNPGPAPAARLAGDRTAFDGARLLGNAGVLQADGRRTYLRGCYAEGDADIVRGQGTTVLDGCTVRSVGPGNVLAGGTVLVNGGRLEGDPAKSVSLGNSGAAVVRDAWLGAHVMDDPWAGEGRFAEYRNTGPGAAVTADRPQLTDRQAPRHTVERYLAGWRP